MPPLARDYGDADFLGRSADRKRITAFMEAEGYEADRMFNALHGATRLNYHEPVRLTVTRHDWGLEHTIHRSLSTLRELIPAVGLAPPEAERILARADELDASLHAAPKGTKWKLRARVGERVRWYEEPEEGRG